VRSGAKGRERSHCGEEGERAAERNMPAVRHALALVRHLPHPRPPPLASAAAAAAASPRRQPLLARGVELKRCGIGPVVSPSHLPQARVPRFAHIAAAGTQPDSGEVSSALEGPPPTEPEEEVEEEQMDVTTGGVDAVPFGEQDHITFLPGGLCAIEHAIRVPLDYEKPETDSIEVFVREVVLREKMGENNSAVLPYIMYLQGGPGFPSPRPPAPPSGWMKSALSQGYRVLLLDQRGTGRSTPLTRQTLQHRLEVYGAEETAKYVSLFRANSIVNDCEVLRSCAVFLRCSS